MVENGSIYTGDGSSVEKDHPSSINTGTDYETNYRCVV